MKGKVVSKVPPKTPVRSTIDWDSPAKLAKLSGQPVLAAEQVRNSRIKAVRQYTRPPFKDHDGRIIVTMRNSHTGADGVLYGDVYFTWAPNEKEEK